MVFDLKFNQKFNIILIKIERSFDDVRKICFSSVRNQHTSAVVSNMSRGSGCRGKNLVPTGRRSIWRSKRSMWSAAEYAGTSCTCTGSRMSSWVWKPGLSSAMKLPICKVIQSQSYIKSASICFRFDVGLTLDRFVEPGPG